MSRVIIVGGGAAGMIAGITAARRGHRVVLLEKNEKLGKKVFITGKGRCNITNAGDEQDFFASLNTNPKFMYSAFHAFGNYDAMGFFDELGLKIKVERGNRVFPASDHASDVIQCMSRELKRLGVKISLHTEAEQILVKAGCFTGVKTAGGLVEGDAVIIATGGKSYPSTGSTGDGYRFASQLGHQVTPLLPALVPLTAREEWVKDLQGLSLKNVAVSVMDGERTLYGEFGEMLFTHFGVSGPVILSASSKIAGTLRHKPLSLTIDLKPALTEEQLDERILRDFGEEQNRQFKNALDNLLPKKLIPVMIDLSGISESRRVNEITRQERKKLVHLFKHLTLTLTGLKGFNEAIITQGGVDVKQINPSTMASKIVKNVYFAGEILDVDAVTGGYNLQVAWSTGFLAASSVE